MLSKLCYNLCVKRLIKIPKKLIELSHLFQKCGQKLYIVGGYVRNALLNIYNTDIDICSSCISSSIKEILSGSSFAVKPASLKLGTNIIQSKNFIAEHTTFRVDNYQTGGKHSPQSVSFVADIMQDATRRDFTINSLYYDITDNKIIDFYNGINDLQKKQVKAILTPEEVFKSDGLRILRMVRIASELNFKIERNTFNCAKKLACQLNDISHERISAEFELMLNSKNKYNLKQNTKPFLFSLKNLINLDVLKHIFNLKKIVSYNQFKLTKKVNEKLLFFALVYDLCTIENVNPESILSIFFISKQKKKEVTDIVTALINIKEKNFNRIELAKNINSLPNILNLLYYINRTSYKKIKNEYNLFLKLKLPKNILELDVSGNDLLSLKIASKKIGLILNNLYEKVIYEKIKNKKSELLNYVTTHMEE